MKQIIRISEGRGDLHSGDIEGEYVDYICYEQYELDNGMPEIDEGRVLLKETLRDKYSCIADCIQDVLSIVYGTNLIDCSILA